MTLMTFGTFATFISTAALLALSWPLLHSPYILLQIASLSKLGGGEGMDLFNSKCKHCSAVDNGDIRVSFLRWEFVSELPTAVRAGGP